jgi:hypothetical protein
MLKKEPAPKVAKNIGRVPYGAGNSAITRCAQIYGTFGILLSLVRLRQARVER